MTDRRPVTAPQFFFVADSPEQEREDLRHILSQPQGRRLLRRLLGTSGVLHPSWAMDGRSTEYNEGLRAMGLWLAVKAEECEPGATARLMAESASDRTR